MAGDALISVGVIVAAGLILVTGWTWLDPAVSIAIVAVIVAAPAPGACCARRSTWPWTPRLRGADLPRIEAFLRASPGVTEVHDLHVWGMSTTETALTAHLVRPEPRRAGTSFRSRPSPRRWRTGSACRHATLQIEHSRGRIIVRGARHGRDRGLLRDDDLYEIQILRHAEQRPTGARVEARLIGPPISPCLHRPPLRHPRRHRRRGQQQQGGIAIAAGALGLQGLADPVQVALGVQNLYRPLAPPRPSSDLARQHVHPRLGGVQLAFEVWSA